MMVQLGNGMTARVTKCDDKEVAIDANHPLAGKPLTFEVQVLKATNPQKLQKATFGMGCFWGPELRFQRVPGVVGTAVGYCNGTTENPTYEDVCSGNTGHVEAVQVLYNPQEVSYEALLEEFFEGHDSSQLNKQGGDIGTQYRSGIYFHNDAQRQVRHLSLIPRDPCTQQSDWACLAS